MTKCMKNGRNMFPLTWKAYMKQAAAHTVRGLRVKLQSAKSECGGWAGGSKCVFTLNSSDLTQIPSHAKVSTVREVFILNQRLNSYDSMQSVFLFPFLIQGFRSLTSSEGVLRAQSYFRKLLWMSNVALHPQLVTADSHSSPRLVLLEISSY